MASFTVESLGVQNLWDRYQTSVAVRQLKRFRLNLAQLSAEHNIVFVAHGSQILVGTPSFPTQKLGYRYPVTIDTLPSAPNLRGYIDPRHPHSINNLLVHHLGSEEIVVAVRDDGDVDAYLTRHVIEAMAHSKCESSTALPVPIEIRPVLHRNVGNSAWGLAVHTEARLIAVSSNNHEFNIFSFALVGCGQDTGNPRLIAHDRKEDLHITIPNGEANIPCISFCNTGHDPGGRWLLTTDVSGVVRSWDLHAKIGGNGFLAGTRPRASNVYSALTSEAPNFESPDRTSDSSILELAHPVWDLTDEPFHLKSSEGRAFSVMRPTLGSNASGARLPHEDTHSLANSESVLRSLSRISVSIGEETDHESEDELVLSTISNRDDPGLFDDSHDYPLTSMAVALDAGPSESLRFLVHDNEREAISQPTQTNALPADTGPLPSEDGEDVSNVDDHEDEGSFGDDDEDEEWDHDGGKRRVWIRMLDTGAICPDIPCPIFYSSVQAMYLLQPPAASRPRAENHFPVVLMGNHWHGIDAATDSTPQRLRRVGLERLERCSLFAQIPTLGVVVVGNQIGRVAVLSGFKAHQQVDFPVTRDVHVKVYKWVYGLRLEAMLPFASQEEERLWPHGMLYGMTIAPMQGCQHLPDDQKRWRLMFMYTDETVYSYEIKRKPGSRGVMVSDVMF
ncbi:hypothetical protein ANO11243_016380 [Dothideomycetidae sp. 11243]|nr:hypothetical protein ANO11243_016380 [fungal sp. No.11243]